MIGYYKLVIVMLLYKNTQYITLTVMQCKYTYVHVAVEFEELPL